MTEKYTLDIISHHKDFEGKALRKFKVDGIDTIGAYAESFSVRFKNNTGEKVQVKISIDGIDTSTGELATTEATKEMWVVEAYAAMTLSAWRETDQGGASFVFTNLGNSVAAHTTGNTDCSGIIGAAVYTEGHKELPWKYIYPRVMKEYVPYPVYPPVVYPRYPYWDYTITNTGFPNTNISINGNYGTNFSSASLNTNGGEVIGSCESESNEAYTSEKEQEHLVAVGAGQYQEQKITYTSGLVQPLLTETLRIKALWWDTLVEKLRTQDTALSQEQPSGFPADGKKIDLKGTLRLKEDRVQKVMNRMLEALSRV
jgi:hypothetical protein